MKVRPSKYTEGRDAVSFRCEGCGGAHTVTITGPGAWQYNGDPERPVLSPSVLVRYGLEPDAQRCHSFVGCHGAAPGEIIFLSDCTHDLAGQVRPLPDWTDLAQGETP